MPKFVETAISVVVAVNDCWVNSSRSVRVVASFDDRV